MGDDPITIVFRSPEEGDLLSLQGLIRETCRTLDFTRDSRTLKGVRSIPDAKPELRNVRGGTPRQDRLEQFGFERYFESWLRRSRQEFRGEPGRCEASG